MLNVTVRPKPIDPRVKRFKLPDGLTLSEIVERANLPDVEPILTVLVNERPIPRRAWPDYRPTSSDRVFLTPVYHGGGGGASPAGGGGKQGFFQIVGMLAGTIPGLGTFGQLALGVGLAAASALLQKKPKQIRANNDAPAQQPQAGFSANQLAPFDPIPAVFGQMRMAPPLLTDLWIVATSPQDLEARGVIGAIGRYDVDDIRANGMPIDDADGVDYETFDGNGTAAFTLHDHTGVTDDVGIELKKHETTSDASVELSSALKNGEAIPQWYSFLTKKAPDEIIINLQFPSGMSHRSSASATIFLHLRIRMRRKGTTAWRNLPEIQIRSTKSSASTFQRRIRIKWFDGLGGRLGNETAAVQGSASEGAWYYESDQGNGTLGPASWTADAYFAEGVSIGDDVNNQAGHTLGNSTLQEAPDPEDEEEEDPQLGDGFDFIAWLHTNAWPQDYYEVQIKRSAITTSHGNAVGTNSSVGRWNEDGAGTRVDPFLYYEPDPGEFRIAPAQGPMTDTVILHSITYKWVEAPLQRPDTFGIAFRLRNTQVDHMTALLTSVVTTPNNTAGWLVTEASRNPAALFRHALTNEVINADPLDSELVPDDFLEWWFDYCVENELYCDMIVDGGRMDEVLPLIARAGDAFLNLSGRAWKVWVDYDRSEESPLVVFSPRNTRAFTVERNFEDVPHAIRATFLDAADENRQREIIVYDDPYDADTATNILAEDFKGITVERNVRRAALRQLRRGRLRRNLYQWETNLSGLTVEKGDLVGLSYDVIAGFYGWGFIKDVITDTSGNITSITLDNELTLPSSVEDVLTMTDVLSELDLLAVPAYVAITLRDGTEVIEAETTSLGRTNVLTFSPGIPAEPLIQEQCHVAVARYGETHRRLIIQSVTPGPDMTHRITATDEAPGIFTE